MDKTVSELKYYLDNFDFDKYEKEGWAVFHETYSPPDYYAEFSVDELVSLDLDRLTDEAYKFLDTMLNLLKTEYSYSIKEIPSFKA